MKKVILLFAAIAITAGAYAQTDSTNTKLSPRDMNHNQIQHMQHSPVHESHPDGVMMKNGKMMMVKNGQFTALDHEMTMSNGTKVMADGTCTKKDSTKMRMKDGQHMDMSGNMNHMKTNRDKKMDFNQDAQNNRVDKSCPDGVMMKDGKIMKVKDGKTTALDQDMTMSNGTKVMADGTWIKKDGTKKLMKEGEHIDMDGNLISMEAKKDKNMYLVPDSTRKQDY